MLSNINTKKRRKNNSENCLPLFCIVFHMTSSNNRLEQMFSRQCGTGPPQFSCGEFHKAARLGGLQSITGVQQNAAVFFSKCFPRCFGKTLELLVTLMLPKKVEKAKHKFGILGCLMTYRLLGSRSHQASDQPGGRQMCCRPQNIYRSKKEIQIHVIEIYIVLRGSCSSCDLLDSSFF